MARVLPANRNVWQAPGDSVLAFACEKSYARFSVDLTRAGWFPVRSRVGLTRLLEFSLFHGVMTPEVVCRTPEGVEETWCLSLLVHAYSFERSVRRNLESASLRQFFRRACGTEGNYRAAVAACDLGGFPRAEELLAAA